MHDIGMCNILFIHLQDIHSVLKYINIIDLKNRNVSFRT